MPTGELRAFIGLVALTGCCAVLVSWVREPNVGPGKADREAPTIQFTPDGMVRIDGATGADIRYTLDGSAPDVHSRRYAGPFVPETQRIAEKLTVVPTSVQWRHPVGGFPHAVVVRACIVDELGRSGPAALATSLPGGSASLPVVTVTVDPASFFDADEGIYVVGNAIFHTDEVFVKRYPDDQKWWKYPGNFLFRGRAAERRAQLAHFPNGSSAGDAPDWSAEVGLRVNGNNTRGFPQHALRVLFDQPMDGPLFGSRNGTGHQRMLLRTSGNDQDRTFFRDALQHRLCRDLPFATAACEQVLVYLNGTYWGLHNMRERLDDKEIARRYGLRSNRVTILADRLELYKGDPLEVGRFGRFLTHSERWNADDPAFVDSLMAHMDLDGFLTYMAANILFGNTDWPDQNGKWWRYTGKPDTLPGPRDGRWRFMLGDSDLSFGLTVGPTYDMFAHIERHAQAPLSRLYLACMRSPLLRQRFRAIMIDLLDGPLSPGRMEAEARGMRDAIAGEMPRHIRRWRRPLTLAAWQGHVAELLTFARERDGTVRAQLDARFPSGPQR